MSGKENITTTGAWRSWKKYCAVDLCENSMGEELRNFGRFAFQSQLKKYASSIGHDSSPLNPVETGDAWHLLETHARVASNRAGKRYKDWLFQRAPEGVEWLNAVEAGAVLLMRDVVREQLRREYAPSFMTSMNRPVCDSGHTLEDLIPDNAQFSRESDREKREEEAGTLAAEIHPRLDSRERIAIWARNNGFSLNDERVLKWTKCSRSALYEIHRKAVESICDEIKKYCPDESPSEQLCLARTVLEELGEIISLKINQENRATRFFKKV